MKFEAKQIVFHVKRPISASKLRTPKTLYVYSPTNTSGFFYYYYHDFAKKMYTRIVRNQRTIDRIKLSLNLLYKSIRGKIVVHFPLGLEAP